MSADKYLKWYTPIRGLVALLFAVGVWVGATNVRVSHAEEQAKAVAPKVEQIQKDVATMKGQLKILVDIATKQATSGNTTTTSQ